MTDSLDFVEAPTRKTLFGLFLPVMLSMVLNIAYSMVDIIWIGNLLGDQAIASPTNATPLISLTFGFGMGITNGMGILTAQAVGMKDQDKVKERIASSLALTAILCVLVTGALELFLTDILVLLNTPPETFEGAENYLRAYLLGTPAVFGFCYLSAMLRCYGDAAFQVIAMCVTGVLNAVLDPVFIHFLAFQGAAYATLISQLVALVVMIVYLFKKKYLTVDLAFCKVRSFKKIFSASFPTVVQQCVPSLSLCVLTACVSNFGVAAIAAYGVIGKLELFLYYPEMSLNMVLTPIVGYCLGARRMDRAEQYTRSGVRMGIAIVAAVAAVFMACSPDISRIFGCGPEARAIVGQCFLIISLGYVLNVWTQCTLAKINGYGRTVSGMVITIFNHLLTRIPVAYYLSGTALGLNGVWIAVAASFVVAFAMAAVLNHVETRIVRTLWNL